MAEPIAIDRRQRRRQETIDEILSHAVAVMAEQGVAGLSLGEVARRMGIRTPSLYGYFPSKQAVYDAVFEQGARAILDEITCLNAELGSASEGGAPLPLAEQLLRSAKAFASWSLTNPVHAQLLFWRPVPGFEPSARAYAPSVALIELTRGWFETLHADGLLRTDADLGAAMRDWIVLTAGVVSQQLANAPGETVDDGHFTAALPSLTEMFVTRYGAPSARRTASTSTRRKTAATRKKVSHAHQR